MTRTLVRQRGARPLTGREMRVCVDAGTRWAWQLEDALAEVYDVQIRAIYDQAAKLLARRSPLTAASPPAAWTIPDPDELGLSLRSQMDDRHARRQAGDDASEAIRVEAIRRVTDAGLQAMFVSLSVRNSLVEGVLRDQLGGKITGIRETTRRDIMGKLEESWKAGDSIPRAAAALRAAAPEIAASRSRTIARTEMLAAVNGGAHALASISNETGAADGQPPLLKIWLTAEDELVRDSHVDAGDAYGAGSGIPIDEPFEVGDSRMQFPGDPDGSAGEVINCRCALSYEEESDPAPSSTSDVVAEAIESPEAPAAPSTMEELARLIEATPMERRVPESTADPASFTEEGNRVLVDAAGETWNADQLRGMFNSRVLADHDLVVEAASQDEGHGQAVVHAIIRTKEGGSVAEMQRSIDLAHHTVHHDSFFITNDDYKGIGIAKDVMRSSVLEYDMAGIERVTVSAAGSNGKYTWARFGFDFQDAVGEEGGGRDAARMRDHFRGEFYRHAQAAGFDFGEARSNDAITAKLREFYPRSMARIDAAEHTWEFAGMSVDENGLRIADFGKQSMLSGRSWSGVLDLDPASASRKVFDDYTA